MDDKVSAEFTCKCGKQKGWITEGKEHSNPCPHCNRKYRGEYNKKTYQIDAIELCDNKVLIKNMVNKCWKWTCRVLSLIAIMLFILLISGNLNENHIRYAMVMWTSQIIFCFVLEPIRKSTYEPELV